MTSRRTDQSYRRSDRRLTLEFSSRLRPATGLRVLAAAILAIVPLSCSSNANAPNPPPAVPSPPATASTPAVPAIPPAPPAAAPAAPGTPVTAGPVGTPAAPAAANARQLRYQWKPGETYVYSVQLEIEDGDFLDVVSGNCTYAVSSPSGGAGQPENVTLACRANVLSSRRAKPGKTLSIQEQLELNRAQIEMHMQTVAMGPFRSRFAPTEVVVDMRGEILKRKQDKNPKLLGDLPSLVIDPLPATPQASWQTGGECQIGIVENEDNGPPTSGPGPRPPFGPGGPRGRQPKKTILTADERLTYTLGASSGDTVVIQKHYEMKTREKVGSEPALQATGDGPITFDTRLGVPRAMEFKATIAEAEQNVTVRVPMVISYKLLEGEELERVLHPPAPAKTEPNQAGAPQTAERKVPSEAEFAKALDDLKSSKSHERRGAANTIGQVPPTDRREEVIAALKPLLEDKDVFVRRDAVRALGAWGTESEDALNLLINAVGDKDHTVRQGAFEALGNYKQERAAEAVAERAYEDRNRAFPALRQMGAVAEKSLIKLLKDRDVFVRVEACRVLKDTGTKSSVAALQQAAKDSNGMVSGAAKDALQAVAKRKE